MHSFYRLRPDFTSKLVHVLAFGTPKFYIAPYDKIKHELVNLSSNCDVKSGLRSDFTSKLVYGLAFGTPNYIAPYDKTNLDWPQSFLFLCYIYLAFLLFFFMCLFNPSLFLWLNENDWQQLWKL